MAFVFGTSVIATLKHRDLGQVDYTLGGLMIAGTATGLELGKRMVVALEAVGLADSVISIGYVILLGGIGLFVTRDSLSENRTNPSHGDELTGAPETGIERLGARIQSCRLPPHIELRGGTAVSLWMILGVAFVTGVLSGFLGVGGGFIRMPALYYLVGVPLPIAVGTDLFEIVFSGGIGTFLYAQLGGVELEIVLPLLTGSALGARLGSAATSLVEETEIKVYFGVMLLLGSVAVALKELGRFLDIETFHIASVVVIFGAAVLVAGAVVYRSIVALREPTARASTAD
jgi:hypothetical protein